MASSGNFGKCRVLLVLGRVSNLPTVWSNCLAGWLLAGGGPKWRLLLLACSASLLYTAGMFLNDAFDSDFDLAHRKERPIPSGAVSISLVWQIGLTLLVVGLLLLLPLGKTAFAIGLALAASIVLYDAVHKHISWSPVLMASCRVLLFILAASIGQFALPGLAIWSALALGVYVIGLSYLAKSESLLGIIGFWPCYLLLAPILLAVIVDKQEPFWTQMFFCCFVLGIWILRSIWLAFWRTPPAMGQAVSGLLAGIVLTDILATLGGPLHYLIAFTGFYLLALLFQKFIPAT